VRIEGKNKMANTIYSSFSDSSLAEKAVGALLDHGVRANDVSVVRGNQDITNEGVGYDGASPLPVNDQAWTGENRGTETQRLSYTGAAYNMDATGLGTSPLYNQAIVENSAYGDVAEKTLSNENQPTVYPEDREVENGQAMSGAAVGHNPNNWPREDHNRENDIERAAKGGISTTTGADAGVGAIKGLGWGAGIGVVAAIAALAIPGVGLVLGGGALAAALGGVAATAGAGAAAGAVTGYLKDQGMDEHVAAHFEKSVNNGGAIVAVTFPSGNADEIEVRQILEKYGAVETHQPSRGYVA
jgi:hypothetical protein